MRSSVNKLHTAFSSIVHPQINTLKSNTTYCTANTQRDMHTWHKVLVALKLTVTGKNDSGRVLGTTNSSEPVRLLASMISMDHSMMDLRASYRQSPSTYSIPYFIPSFYKGRGANHGHLTSSLN